MYVGAPPEGWRLHLREILDPPLALTTCVTLLKPQLENAPTLTFLREMKGWGLDCCPRIAEGTKTKVSPMGKRLK